MIRSNPLFSLAAALAASMMLPCGAEAFWASHGSMGSWGSRGSAGSYGSYGSAGSYGSYGSMGSRGSRGSYGSYGASHGSWGSRGSRGSAGSHGSYSSASHGSYSSGSHGSYVAVSYVSSSSHGSYSSHGGYSAGYSSTGSHGSTGGAVYSSGYSSSGSHGGSTVIYSEGYSSGSHGSTGGVVYSSDYASTSTVAGEVVVASAEASVGSGSLRVTVPADAVVYVNDHKTTSTGSQRQYVSNGLSKGQSYTYKVRVEFERDGKTQSETKLVALTAGGEASLAFESDAPTLADDSEKDHQSATTKLTLEVPADASVTLAGAQTKQEGVVREFATTRLSAGETWEDYVVEVKAVVDGKPRTERRVITLRGGDTQRLVFNFAGGDDVKLASAN